ncbi:hypothetical protein V501_09786 [Pseudogymnoascus sp. VKM F-4519 (FW-2642)]|nr:hypothetical protein V501_09786 [Pseudogymnoascus sp. VKM F-4519 (FW-2642)]
MTPLKRLKKDKIHPVNLWDEWYKERYAAQKEYDDAQRGIQMESLALQARALDLEKKNVALQARVLDLEEKEVRENKQAALCDICRRALNSQLYFRH